MFGLSNGGLMLGGAAAIALLAFGAGWTFRGDRQASSLGKNFVKYGYAQLQTSTREKANLYGELNAARRRMSEIIGLTQKVDQLSAEARAKTLRALEAEKVSNDAAAELAARRMDELRRAADVEAEEWKRGRPPRSLTCGVYDGRGCEDPRPASGAGADGDVALRQPAAGADGAARLP